MQMNLDGTVAWQSVMGKHQQPDLGELQVEPNPTSE